MLISTISAPQARSCAVMSCNSAPGTSGLSKSALPPPERRKSTVSSAVRFSVSAIASRAAENEFSSGTGWPASRQTTPGIVPCAWPYFVMTMPVSIRLAERRHRRRRHAPRRLSRSDEDHAPRKVCPVERAPDGFIRQHGFDRAGIDILRVLAQRTHEPITSFGSAFAKSIAPFSSFVNKSGRKNVR